MELRLMFNQTSVGELGAAIAEYYPDFETNTFSGQVFCDVWPELALKARMRHITEVLTPLLPADFNESIRILKQAIRNLGSQSFEKMVFPDFVELNGGPFFRESLAALEYFTCFASAEFAIRPFIRDSYDRTMEQMFGWSKHKEPAVRRLSTEGCRPLLPWAMRVQELIDQPDPVWRILENLLDDPDENVRRSVANNLNDMSKLHVDEAVARAKSWVAFDNPEREKLVRHGLRTLFKKGHPEALRLFGFSNNPDILVGKGSVSAPRIRIGDKVEFRFEIQSTGSEEQLLMVDFVVTYQKASGKTSEKVFKLKSLELGPNEKTLVSKTISFAPISTRKYYVGRHAVQLQINGTRFAKVDFDLVRV